MIRRHHNRLCILQSVDYVVSLVVRHILNVQQLQQRTDKLRYPRLKPVRFLGNRLIICRNLRSRSVATDKLLDIISAKTLIHRGSYTVEKRLPRLIRHFLDIGLDVGIVLVDHANMLVQQPFPEFVYGIVACAQSAAYQPKNLCDIFQVVGKL